VRVRGGAREDNEAAPFYCLVRMGVVVNVKVSDRAVETEDPVACCSKVKVERVRIPLANHAFRLISFKAFIHRMTQFSVVFAFGSSFK
jgi:hypothetical protein